MTELTHSELSNTEAAVRRAVAYTFLAHCFAYPDESAVAAMQEAAQAATPFVAGTPLAGLMALASTARSKEIEADHVRLFTLSSSPDCPSFESAFFSGDPIQQTNRMADIAGFYRAFGVDAGAPGFRPDDICVELEFMGYLCRKQVYAAEHLGAPRVGQTLRAQRMFLEEHLGQWAGALGGRIAVRADHEFYREAGTALAHWISEDCQLLRAFPPQVATAPSPDWASAELADVPETDRPLIGFDDIAVM